MIGYEGAPRYASAIIALTGDEEIVPPGIILELDRPEWRYLKRELLWTTGFLTAAAAPGNNGKLKIFPGAGQVMVVLGARIFAKATAGVARLTMDSAIAGGAIAPNRAMDSRVPLNASIGELSVSSTNRSDNAAQLQGIVLDRWSVGLGADADCPLLQRVPAVITPGHNLCLINETLNEVVQGIFYGYDRPVRPEELAL